MNTSFNQYLGMILSRSTSAKERVPALNSSSILFRARARKLTSDICDIRITGTEVILRVYQHSHDLEDSTSLSDEDGKSLMEILEKYLDLKCGPDTGGVYLVKIKGRISTSEQEQLKGFFTYLWDKSEIKDSAILRALLSNLDRGTIDAEGSLVTDTEGNLTKMKPFLEAMLKLIDHRLEELNGEVK